MQVHRVAAAEAEQPPDQILVAVRPGEAALGLVAVLPEDVTEVAATAEVYDMPGDRVAGHARGEARFPRKITTLMSSPGAL